MAGVFYFGIRVLPAATGNLRSKMGGAGRLLLISGRPPLEIIEAAKELLQAKP
jgi:hypothetical protein